ncbi:hypothetical protein [Actinokineospora sp. UTMC 2448]|uniref:hypothetical protein n=1 Tax=Actinokineospora sp. UTMC 2448 TaxID=2268449 RepID=UPI002164EBF5|nr:hypothetical protein [Actinokineospora sp. UTMC 2448]UVS82120.1 hypothetical protein Actkin_05885 [Actinokineospora sp. UTMC 2448]
MARGELRVDTEAVSATVARFAEVTDALAAMVRHGRGDAFAPARLGPLGDAAGRAYADRADALLTSLERAVAAVDGIGEALTAADRAVIDADEDAAAMITRAGER